MNEQQLKAGSTKVLLDGFTAYMRERREERYQPPGQPPWRELRKGWMEHILFCAAEMEGLDPGGTVRQFEQALGSASENQAVEVSSISTQQDTVRTLGQYMRVLVDAEGDHRLQVLDARDLLTDMYLDRLWGGRDIGSRSMLTSADSALIQMTARQPIRFCHVILGPEIGPCESGFLSGRIATPRQLQATEFYRDFCARHPEKRSWPALSVTYAGCDGRFIRDANELDLKIIRDAGEDFFDSQEVRNLDFGHQMVVRSKPEMEMTMTM